MQEVCEYIVRLSPMCHYLDVNILYLVSKSIMFLLCSGLQWKKTHYGMVEGGDKKEKLVGACEGFVLYVIMGS